MNPWCLEKNRGAFFQIKKEGHITIVGYTCYPKLVQPSFSIKSNSIWVWEWVWFQFPTFTNLSHYQLPFLKVHLDLCGDRWRLKDAPLAPPGSHVFTQCNITVLTKPILPTLFYKNQCVIPKCFRWHCPDCKLFKSIL